ncbi:MAG: hypothetical protein QXW00_01730 [Candidatus Woesearchaeota archaeon]
MGEQNLYQKYSENGRLTPYESILNALNHIKSTINIYNFISDYILENTKYATNRFLRREEREKIRQEFAQAIRCYAELSNCKSSEEKARKWLSGLEAILFKP